MIWQELKNPLVRDLAWACFSPSMLQTGQLQGSHGEIENCHLLLTPARAAHLHRLDLDPTPLLAHLEATPHTRLGIYFEKLWHYFLGTDPDTDLLAHNLAVRDRGRTLGEFDILYLCRRRQQHIHLELAVKFYLGVPASEIWLGPAKRDQLAFKIAHLTRRQIQLGVQPQAQLQLRRLGISKLQRQIEVKGYLFAPGSEPPRPPPAYNPELALCNWYSIEQFQALPAPETAWVGWQRIGRERWLSPLRVTDTAGAPTHTTVLAQLQHELQPAQRPRLMACCDQFGNEIQRCFVTPAGWPKD